MSSAIMAGERALAKRRRYQTRHPCSHLVPTGLGLACKEHRAIPTTLEPMTTKERLHRLIDELPDTPENEQRLAAAESALGKDSRAHDRVRDRAAALGMLSDLDAPPVSASERQRIIARTHGLGPVLDRLLAEDRDRLR